jgi:hypothetical protein
MSQIVSVILAHIKCSKTTIVLTLALCALIAVAVGQSFADDHGENLRRLKNKAASLVEVDHEGDETTGQTAAWLLGAANLTIALSILIKWTKALVPLKPQTENSLNKFNATQKKYLRPFHYYLNPLIFCVALAHWLLSRCKSTSIPEWGLTLMGIIILLGIALKFKLCPKSLKGDVYRWHTQPVLFVALILVLLAGHFMMD